MIANWHASILVSQSETFSSRVCLAVIGNTGAAASVLSKAAADDAAWTELQRGAAWWLGEFSNAAAREVAGNPAGEDDDNGLLDDDDLARISPAEVLAMKVRRQTWTSC